MSEPESFELTPRSTSLFGDEEVALVDLLDRLLAGGVVLVGDLTISLAGVDLVRISLRALITSIAPVERPGTLAARAERADRELEAGDG
ncbi:gas vesicle protein [Actinomycetospora cinnamomea]|uniref:Gas vesicle protein GvpA/GvpJ/GvpM family n=1 Tax=Actinomycetospora cinnamomea TaxID=663609 RepID=A0A2U1FBJ3_9PSEU|nr:gas vesicle protein GvpA/GvpJ/GvpM family [Actinomycetospora cinnamomea]